MATWEAKKKRSTDAFLVKIERKILLTPEMHQLRSPSPPFHQRRRQWVTEAKNVPLPNKAELGFVVK